MSQSHLSEQSIVIADLHKRGRAIFENLRPELMQNHHNWFILIEPESGDYFVDQDEIVALTKAREKHPQVPFAIFRLNETGLCGRV
jgi:hypothetical protein